MRQMGERRRRWLAALGAGAGAVVVLGGCGAADRGPAAGVPNEFAQRPTLFDCGRVRMGPGVAEADGAAVACFDDALAAGTGAELVVDVTTTEGDPVVEYYRAVPDAPGLEIFTDSRRDAFSNAGWSYSRCPKAITWMELGDCQYHDLL